MKRLGYKIFLYLKVFTIKLSLLYLTFKIFRRIRNSVKSKKLPKNGKLFIGLTTKPFPISRVNNTTTLILNLKIFGQKSTSFLKCFPNFAVWTGLEPATPCVTGRYSNQLNYQTVAVMRVQIYYSF